MVPHCVCISSRASPCQTFNPFATKELRDVIVMLDDPESRSPRYVELEDAAAAPELRICPVHWVTVQGVCVAFWLCGCV